MAADPLTWSALAWLVLAGVGAGLVGYLTGLASLVSFPALITAGLSPVAANVTNTLSLVGVGIGSTARAGRDLVADWRTLVPQAVVAGAGGLVGALLLLYAGDSVFEKVVPWLVILVSVAVLLQPWLRGLRRQTPAFGWYLVAMFAISVYGGYFGAGAGTIYLAVTLLLTSMSFSRVMILKSTLLAVTNLIAAVVFIVFGEVNWWAAIAMGIGCVLGGNLGPWVQKLLPERVLRIVVAVSGLGLAIWLFLR